MPGQSTARRIQKLPRNMATVEIVEFKTTFLVTGVTVKMLDSMY